MKQEGKKSAADKRYFKVPDDIFDSGLTKYELLVCVYLLYFQNHKPVEFPGYEDIAKHCAVSRSKAKKIVNGLIKKDIIKKQIGTQSYKKNRTDWYAIVLNDKHHLKQL